VPLSWRKLGGGSPRELCGVCSWKGRAAGELSEVIGEMSAKKRPGRIIVGGDMVKHRHADKQTAFDRLYH